MTATGYFQGQYAGPHTVRAMDYNGHEVVGVQVSDAAPDGACFFVTLDEHMMVSMSPVIAASIHPYEPEEPPLPPEIEPEDYEATRKSLERIVERMLSKSIETPDQLRACAIAMSELADVVDAQIRLEARPHAGQAPGQALDCSSDHRAERADHGSATQSGEGSAFTAEVGSAALADGQGKPCTEEVGSAALADRTEVQL